MLDHAGPFGINLNSPVTWFVVAVGFVVLALTVSTRRVGTRPRGAFTRPPNNAFATGAHVRFAAEWSAAQARFLEDPRTGCRQAQAIVATVLERRGFALTPELMDRRYRAGCKITARAGASTDELRRAFVDFRAAFDTLVADESELLDP